MPTGLDVMAALGNDLIHAAQHLCFLLTGAFMWASLLETMPGPRWFGTGAKISQGGPTEAPLEEKAEHADPGVEGGEGGEERSRREAIGGLGLEQEVHDGLHHGPQQDHEGDAAEVGVAEDDDGHAKLIETIERLT